MDVELFQSHWLFERPFRMVCRTRVGLETARVRLTDDSFAGQGEAIGVSYRGETVQSILAQLEDVRWELSVGISRRDLNELLPAGGARNAVDCALWDLEAKRLRRRAWELAGLTAVRPLFTAYTLSLDSPENMAYAATQAHRYSTLKLKLSGEGDLERVLAVRAAHPDAVLIVDANESWSERHLKSIAPEFAKIGVSLIEQPLPAEEDGALLHYRSPVPLCADESCQTTESIQELVGKYQYVNIKLDKTGGLTEALRLAREAARAGLRLMVGCMSGSSLSMAPAFIVGQLCDFVDLDGPLLLASDVIPPIRYDGSQMYAPEAILWG